MQDQRVSVENKIKSKATGKNSPNLSRIMARNYFIAIIFLNSKKLNSAIERYKVAGLIRK